MRALQAKSLYTDYIYWLAHIYSTDFLGSAPTNLFRLSMRDIEIILRTRTQVLKNKRLARKEHERLKRVSELTKMKQMLLKQNG